MKCIDHPRYKAINRPAVSCPPCWAMYLLGHPEELNRPGVRLALVMQDDY